MPRPRPERGLELAQGDRRRPAGREPVARDRGRLGAERLGRRIARRRSARARALGIGAVAPTASIEAVGHRVVHGGDAVHRADADRRRRSSRPSTALARPRAAPQRARPRRRSARRARRCPDVPHVAVFDTAFHATLPPEAFRYPVPERWFERVGHPALRLPRAVGRAGRSAGPRSCSAARRRSLALVVAHLGSGCSVTAVHGGRSVDTSMGHDAARGPDDGHPLRLDRPRHRHPAAPRRADRPLTSRRTSTTVRAARRSAGTADVADTAGREAAGDERRRWRSRCSSGARPPGSRPRPRPCRRRRHRLHRRHRRARRRGAERSASGSPVGPHRDRERGDDRIDRPAMAPRRSASRPARTWSSPTRSWRPLPTG